MNERPCLSGSEVGREEPDPGDLPAETGRTEPTSHVEALKSTSIIGGASVIVLLIRMLRTKAMAVLLGPVGVGVEAMFDSILALARMAVDLGISNSGVRQIAAAAGSSNAQVIAATVLTLRRTCLLLGALAAVTLFIAREPISYLAFGNRAHAADIGWLSVIPLLAGIAGGQGALLQGMRRIGDLAKLNVIGALVSALSSIPVVWIWGVKGIPAYLILIASVSLWVSSTFARRVSVEPVAVPISQTAREACSLFRFGIVFLLSGVMTTGALFLLRVLVTREAGVDGAGQFQAASALSMVYVGFILQAMGTDFYPRLTAVATDDRRCNQMVNEQAEISTLLVLPGVLFTIALSPWVIHVFYSSRFSSAAEILAWQVAGMLLKVNAWAMGFILLAKGKGKLIVGAEFAVYAAYAGLGWLGLKAFGLPGLGMAFLCHYIFHWCLTYAIVRRVSGFRWNPVNVWLFIGGVTAAAVALLARLVLAEPWATAVGCTLAAVASLWCVHSILQIIGPERMMRVFHKARPLISLGIFKGRTPENAWQASSK